MEHFSKYYGILLNINICEENYYKEFKNEVMRNTLYISESHYGTSKRVADILSLIVGYGKSIDIKDAPRYTSKYNSLVLVFSFYGLDTAKKIKEYLTCIKMGLKNKKIAVVGVGLSQNDMENYLLDIEKSMDRKADIVEFIEGQLRVNELTDKDKDILTKFFKKKYMSLMDMGTFDEGKVFEASDRIGRVLNKPNNEMNTEELIDEINKFITSHNTCALATSCGEFVRNTPIEYTYYKGNFYFISEGGLKFKGILKNPKVCIAIFNGYTSMKEVKGIQVSGKSEIIPYLCDEYLEIFAFKKITLESIRNLPVTLNLIKVVPEVFELLNTDFNNIGFDSKQYYFAN
jgi:menaquinone-dependent protoporphyrinogen IX oxidase